MIDRSARNALKNTVDDYLLDRITAYTFDDRLRNISDETSDKTVREIVMLLWFSYDDLCDHPVILRKHGWDMIQRLMLASEAGMEFRVDEKHRRVWHISQAVAFGSFLLTCFLCVNVFHSMYALAVGGLISAALIYWRERVERRLDETRYDAWPFSSTMEIRRVLRANPAFKKMKYRAEIANRKKSGLSVEVPEWLVWIPLLAIFSFFSPFVLLFQCRPIKITRDTVVTSA